MRYLPSANWEEYHLGIIMVPKESYLVKCSKATCELIIPAPRMRNCSSALNFCGNPLSLKAQPKWRILRISAAKQSRQH